MGNEKSNIIYTCLVLVVNGRAYQVKPAVSGHPPSRYQELKIPGMSAAIVQNQELVWAQGFGQVDLENNIPAAADTPPNVSWAWAGTEGYVASLGLGEPYQHIPSVYQKLARPYQFDAAYNNVPGAYPLHFSPAAGLMASVNDIAKFDIALDNDQLLRPETKEAMFRPAVSNTGQPMIYGLGWYTQTYNNTRLIWHSGGWPPSVSALYLKVPDENLTFIVLANNYNLTRPYPLGSGDVLYSTPVLAFYKHFVFPQQTGKTVPQIDWSADETELLAQLQRVTDPDVRPVLERELWSYRKLYGSVGMFDEAKRLLRVHRGAFPNDYLSRSDAITTNINGSTPDAQRLSLLPHQVVTISRLLFVWIMLTFGALLFLVIDFNRENEWPRPYKLAWLLLTFLFGIIGFFAYLASGGRHWSRYPALSLWQQALRPALFSTTGNMTGLVLVLFVIYLWFPDGQAALPAILAMFLSGWLLFRTPLAAWETRGRYRFMLPRTFLPELGSTFFILLSSVPMMIYFLDFLFMDVAPDSPLFLIVLVVTAFAGALAVYPYTVWLVSRRNSWVKEDTAVYITNNISRRYST